MKNLTLRKKSTVAALVAAVIGVLSTSAAHAQIINTVSEVDGASNGGTGFVQGTVGPTSTTIAATANLVNSATLSSPDFTSYNGASIAVLNDGSLGSSGTINADTAYDEYSDWTLNVALAPVAGGYTLDNITLISGWDHSGVDQSFSVAYSTVPDPTPTDFISLGSFTAANQNTVGSDLYTLQSTLTETGGGALATHVADLQFTFNNAYGVNNSAYREVEAFGTLTTPSVPEPSTWAMILGGLICLMGLQRFTRKV